MTADCCEPPRKDGASEEREVSLRLRDVPAIRAAIVAGILLIVAFAAGRVLKTSPWHELLYVPALLVGAWTFVPGAVRGMMRGRHGVAALMTLAAAGAVLLGEVGEAASLAFLFSISEGLEAYALTRTRHGLRALLNLVPDVATVRREGRDISIPPSELVVGDQMVVRPGERVATDGVIREGRSAMDFSAITGESVPVERGPGDEVFAGAVNGGGVLTVEVTARAVDNSLARIVRIVEEAQERKGSSQRLAERLAKPLVPGVLILAAVIAIVGSVFGEPSVWIYRALVVLVAAAPCAFAISVPVGVVTAIGAATRSGVLIKGGIALEALERVRVVALDKTGTLTRNAPKVIATIAAAGETEQDVLAVASALEQHSEHPLAKAILEAQRPTMTAKDVQAVAGHGIEGTIDGVRVRLGKPSWIDPGTLTPEVARLQEEGATVVVLERDGRTIGAVAVRDELRPEAVAAVAALRRAGIVHIAMLTGDNRRTAEALGRTAQVDEVEAELLPEDKVARIESLASHGPVAMVGDGINDAPALARAEVGVAMGAMGSDVAIETADVALMGEDLRLLAATLTHGQRAMRVVRQNLLISGGILLTLVPLAAFGVLGLAAVVIAHELAEVLVIANGLRAGNTAAFRLPPLDGQ